MLTKNALNYLMAETFAQSTNCTFVDINETSYSTMSVSNAKSTISRLENKTSANLTNLYSTFTIGSGTSDETTESIKLTNPIDETNFTISSSQVAKDLSYSNPYSVYSQVWTYSGNTPVTINEIGFIAKVGGVLILIDRTKLTSPITVNNSGDSFTLALNFGGRMIVNS